MSSIINYINLLPSDIQKNIFYFIPLNVIMSNETKLIKNIISVYEVDHDPDLSKSAKAYYIKNILSFSSYVFYTLVEQEYYGCIYGRKVYDKIEEQEQEEKIINY